MTNKDTCWIVLGKKPLLKQICNAIITCATIFIVIGVGWYLESSAMQWAGFSILALVVIGEGINSPKRFTPQEAADFLFAEYNVKSILEKKGVELL